MKKLNYYDAFCLNLFECRNFVNSATVFTFEIKISYIRFGQRSKMSVTFFLFVLEAQVVYSLKCNRCRLGPIHSHNLSPMKILTARQWSLVVKLRHLNFDIHLLWTVLWISFIVARRPTGFIFGHILVTPQSDRTNLLYRIVTIIVKTSTVRVFSWQEWILPYLRVCSRNKWSRHTRQSYLWVGFT